MKVLIIDDEEVIRELLCDILDGIGIESQSVSNCKEGFDLLQNSSDFDVVFIDWRTPLMSGVELTQKIRSDSKLNHLKLLMITGKSEAGDIEEALKAGVDEYLMKPFDSEMIRLKLEILGFDVLKEE